MVKSFVLPPDVQGSNPASGDFSRTSCGSLKDAYFWPRDLGLLLKFTKVL